MSAPTCPGYDVIEMLGFGASGEVWLAHAHATGNPVALKRLRAGGTLADRDRLRREAAVLACIDHPHVIRLHEVHGDTADGDAITLVLDLAAGGSLARLLATRGPLRAGEVVTLVVPLAEALASVHDRGLVHGDITPANVLFAGDGRPVLSDLGMCRLLGVASSSYGGTPGFLDPAPQPGALGSESDVFGLAATCLAALGPDPAPGLLLDLLRRASDRDPAARPTAAALADQAFRATRAEPVRLGAGRAYPLGRVLAPGPSTSDAEVLTWVSDRPRVTPAVPAPHVPRRWRRWSWAPGRGREWIAVAAVLGLVVVALLAGAGVRAWRPAPQSVRAPARQVLGDQQVASHPSRLRAPRPSTVALTDPWLPVLTALDDQRARAFAEADRSALTSVYAAGAPAGGRDRASISRLSAHGLHAEGLRLSTLSVQVSRASATTAVLRVTDVLGPYRLVDGAGTVVRSAPGRGSANWVLTLRREGNRWKVYDVARG